MKHLCFSLLGCDHLRCVMLLASAAGFCRFPRSNIPRVHAVAMCAHGWAQSKDMWLRGGCEPREGVRVRGPMGWGRGTRSTHSLGLGFPICNWFICSLP